MPGPDSPSPARVDRRAVTAPGARKRHRHSQAGNAGCTVRRAERFDLQTGPAGADVVFAAFDHPAKDELLALDERYSDMIPWVRLRTHGSRAYLGPAVTPGATVGFRDLLGHRRAATRTPEEDTAFWAQRPDDSLAEDELQWITKSASAVFAS
ncbi:hypothetical protein [Amycolatopsis sp. NPDC051061]|uniref:hypothetical protein n=1 Tax=Amycolatopsis sp. NPDC051061 TaxID=3155042 RepID=UPI0034129257